VSNEVLLGAYVFMLAIWVGNEVISKVPTTLHTPLMSGANAIHGIIVVGAMLVATAVPGPAGTVLGSWREYRVFVVGQIRSSRLMLTSTKIVPDGRCVAGLAKGDLNWPAHCGRFDAAFWKP